MGGIFGSELADDNIDSTNEHIAYSVVIGAGDGLQFCRPQKS